MNEYYIKTNYWQKRLTYNAINWVVIGSTLPGVSGQALDKYDNRSIVSYQSFKTY